MSTELVKVDPKKFGLEEVQVTNIEQAFMPKIAERDGYAVIYEQLITKELTPSLCNEAYELRKKLIKMVNDINLTIPELSDATSVAVVNVISAKFEAFKIWAKSQIVSI